MWFQWLNMTLNTCVDFLKFCMFAKIFNLIDNQTHGHNVTGETWQITLVKNEILSENIFFFLFLVFVRGWSIERLITGEVLILFTDCHQPETRAHILIFRIYIVIVNSIHIRVYWMCVYFCKVHFDAIRNRFKVRKQSYKIIAALKISFWFFFKW